MLFAFCFLLFAFCFLLFAFALGSGLWALGSGLCDYYVRMSGFCLGRQGALLLLGVGVMEKGLRGRNSPMCTLSQNGYGDRLGCAVGLVFLYIGSISDEM